MMGDGGREGRGEERGEWEREGRGGREGRGEERGEGKSGERGREGRGEERALEYINTASV